MKWAFESSLVHIYWKNTHMCMLSFNTHIWQWKYMNALCDCVPVEWKFYIVKQLRATGQAMYDPESLTISLRNYHSWGHWTVYVFSEPCLFNCPYNVKRFWLQHFKTCSTNLLCYFPISQFKFTCDITHYFTIGWNLWKVTVKIWENL